MRPLAVQKHLLAAWLLGLAFGSANAQTDGGDVGTMPSIRDCTLNYRVHPPQVASGAPVVMIAHGFLRRGEFMSGWADAIARSGLAAVTVDLCASSTLNGRHTDNGTDMVELRRKLGITSVIYVGVSAGGLAALIAASLDPEATRGLLLLDPTNAGSYTREAARRVRSPVAALVARPQLCNAWRNIDPALQALPDATIVRIDGASHCNFEWPTDTFCRVACISTGTSERHRRAEGRIRNVGLTFIEALARGVPDALARWKGDIGEAP